MRRKTAAASQDRRGMPWRRPTVEERRMRLSEDWWSGEWLEPVHPDIVRPFVERYLTTMATMRADYLRAQLALIARTEGTDDTDAWEGDTPEPDDAQSSADAGADAGLGNARRSVSFLNLCLIVDQEWTFPVGTRNLRAIGYRPSEEGYAEASMALREEFDRFADFLTGLGPTPGRREVAEAIERKYHYEGDIESWRFLDALARRASRRLAADMLDRWAARSQAAIRGDDAANGTEDAGPVGKVTHTLSQWGLPLAERDGTLPGTDSTTENLAAYRADPRQAWERAKKHWCDCIGRSVRHTPRSRDDVLRWCVRDATLGEVWEAERATWQARQEWKRRQLLRTGKHAAKAEAPESPVVAPPDDGTIADEDSDVMATIVTGALDGGIWDVLLARMRAVHLKVSQGYAKWSPLMPGAGEEDAAARAKVCEIIAATPEFRDHALFATCNALVRGTATEPGDAAEAMRLLLACACARVMVPGTPGDGTDSGELAQYAYVGLARVIRSYPPYEGRCRTLGPDAYRQYLTMIGKKPKADETDDGRRHTVWVFPSMGRELDGKTDESGRESWQVRADEVSAKQGSHGTEGMGIGLTSGDGSDDDIGRDESWSRFHAVTDDAVNTWLGTETVHAAGLDGHGHTLSYRSKDPVVTYQDVNAWRLGEALERYEGPAAWGSGGRLADLYRTRGHLDKGGKPAADRSVRDYAASARGTADAIQYLAAITGLGAMGMLADAERVERFIRIIDRCGQRLGGPAADRFGKAQWSLINVAKDKRHRLTVLDETGRRASAVALLVAMDVTIRKAGTDGGDATAAPAGDPDAIARMARSLKIDRLLRAWGVTDAKGISGGGYGPRDWLTVANAIDLAEHTMRSAVHGLMRKELGGPHRTADGRPPAAAAAADQALGRSRWLARLAATPMPCLGQAMTALIGNDDGTCLFHRSATDRSATTNGRSAR